MRAYVLILVLWLTQISVNALGGLAKSPVKSAWQQVRQKGEITVRNLRLLRKLKSRLSVNSLVPILSEVVSHKVKGYFQDAVTLIRKSLEKLSKSPEMQKVAITFVSDCCKYALVLLLIRTLSDTVRTHVVNVLEYVEKKELSDKNSSNITHYLEPNTTLNAHELEILQSIELPNSIEESFENIGGLMHIKESLIFDFSRYNASTTSQQFSSPRSVLLFGPPGCGKSMIARALCKHLNVPLLKVLPSTLMRKYVGETSQLTRALFTLMKKLQACVVFIDEADSLLNSRENSNHMVDRQLVTEFMQLWDEQARNFSSAVRILGATNRPQDLDPAILRRFERSYFVPPPDLKARYEVLKKHLQGVKLRADCDLVQCAVRAAGFTSSDLAAACRDAGRKQQLVTRKLEKAGGEGQIVPLSTQDILDALKSTVPVRWSAAAYGRYSQASTHLAFNPDSADTAERGEGGDSSNNSADIANCLDLSFEKDSSGVDALAKGREEASVEIYDPDDEEEEDYDVDGQDN